MFVLTSTSFQPFSQVDAGPSLPQPTKVEGEGDKYYFGRGVREPPDMDMAVLAYGGQDLDRTDARRAKPPSASLQPSSLRAASSSGHGAQASSSSQPPHVVPPRWEAVPKSSPEGWAQRPYVVPPRWASGWSSQWAVGWSTWDAGWWWTSS